MTDRQVEGVVAAVNERQVQTRKGATTSYNVAINTGGSGDEWFGFGFKNPGLTQGQVVSFSATKRTYTTRAGVPGEAWDAVAGSLQVSRTAAPSSAPALRKAVSNVDDRQRSIVLQSAYERAIMLVNAGLQFGALTLPAKKNTGWDTYQDMVYDKAMQLAELFINPPAQFVTDEDVIDAEDSTGEFVDDDFTGVV